MLTDYEKQGKEFSLQNKLDYWRILLISSVIPYIIIRIGLLVFGFLMVILMYIILFALIKLGIVSEQDSGSYAMGLIFLLAGPLVVLSPFLTNIITVPLAGYGIDLISNPEESFGSRFGRYFSRFKLINAIGSITTPILISLPFIIVGCLVNYISRHYFHSYNSVIELDTLSVILRSPSVLTDRSDLIFNSITKSWDNLAVVLVMLPAIYASCKLSVDYFLVPYLLALDIGLKGRTARKESKLLMKGHINETFGLFFRLLLLGILSTILVIPLICYIPYAYATLTFYALNLLETGGYVSYAEDEEETVNELDSLLQ